MGSRLSEVLASFGTHTARWYRSLGEPEALATFALSSARHPKPQPAVRPGMPRATVAASRVRRKATVLAAVYPGKTFTDEEGYSLVFFIT